MRLNGPRASTVSNKIYLTGVVAVCEYNIIFFLLKGGRDKNETKHAEIYIFEDEGWLLISRMMQHRSYHAVSIIAVDQNIQKHCSRNRNDTYA